MDEAPKARSARATAARCGSWTTPITSELVVRAARAPGRVLVDGTDVWWSESRPEEGGRIAVLRRGADGSVAEVLGAPWNARTAVHEYGGAAWWVRDGVLWFSDWATQRLHRLDPAATEPVALTPEAPVPRGLRFADGDVSPDGTTVLCVQERHDVASEAVNTVVRLAADHPSEPQVVVAGPDFVSSPRWRPDGGAWSWLEWDHPDMPWDSTRLVVSDGSTRTVVAGGDGAREAICQAEWAADGSLWFSGDRSGFWSLYRWTPDDGVEARVETGLDVGFPHWVFGESCFAVLDDGRVAFVVADEGLEQLGLREPDGVVRMLQLPYTEFDGLRATGSDLVFIGASPSAEAHVVSVALDGPQALEPVVLVPPRDLRIGDEWWSSPEPFDFPSAEGTVGHALLYWPRNPEFEALAGERPPLLVMIHGGPTAAAHGTLRLGVQYWTTRGFAVADVNYRGSTGYGRAYRDLLRGQWGIADVEDCSAAARCLVERGDVDARRLCIRGGSAGGFTTLAAMAFDDVFSAGASHYGVADLGALARDTHKFESRYLDGLVGPWPEARQVYEERSPIFHTDGIDRPLAVFQGLEDEVVPPIQSQMIVDALRAKGVAVAYVTFEGEQHGFRQAANIRAALDGELSFYAQVLGFDLPPDEGIIAIPID